MKKRSSTIALIVSMMTTPAAFAAERIVTFGVDNMTCASCPYIVKTAMAPWNSVRDPSLSASQPLAGVKTASAAT